MLWCWTHWLSWLYKGLYYMGLGALQEAIAGLSTSAKQTLCIINVQKLAGVKSIWDYNGHKMKKSTLQRFFGGHACRVPVTVWRGVLVPAAWASCTSGEGSVDAEMYMQVLKQHMLSSRWHLFHGRLRFLQQDCTSLRSDKRQALGLAWQTKHLSGALRSAK